MTDFSKLDALFDQVYDIATELSADEKNEVREFVDHGEYGLAFSTLVAIYREESKSTSEHIFAIVEEIAKEMGATEDEYASLRPTEGRED
jgi:hypothetical protein